MAYNYDICIVGGLGHVGLPLGISLASAGKKVALYDVDRKAIDLVQSGKLGLQRARGLVHIVRRGVFIVFRSIRKAAPSSERQGGAF